MANHSAYSNEYKRAIPQNTLWDLLSIKSIQHFLISPWLYRLIRIVIAILFYWSGVVKLFDPRSFAVIIEAYGIIPESLIMPVAICLPVLEIITAIGLVADIRGSLTIIAGLLGLFMVILAYGIWLGLDIDCGCFGSEDPEGEAYHGLRSAMFRNFIIMGGMIYLYIWRFNRSTKPVRWYKII